MLGNYEVGPSTGYTEGEEEGSVTRYVYISDHLIITQNPRGDLFALSFVGSSNTTPTVTSASRQGD
jgi:hypothetical protein